MRQPCIRMPGRLRAKLIQRRAYGSRPLPISACASSRSAADPAQPRNHVPSPNFGVDPCFGAAAPTRSGWLRYP